MAPDSTIPYGSVEYRWFLQFPSNGVHLVAELSHSHRHYRRTGEILLPVFPPSIFYSLTSFPASHTHRKKAWIHGLPEPFGSPVYRAKRVRHRMFSFSCFCRLLFPLHFLLIKSANKKNRPIHGLQQQPSDRSN